MSASHNEPIELFLETVRVSRCKRCGLTAFTRFKAVV